MERLKGHCLEKQIQMKFSCLQQLFVGERQDALEDDHISSINGFLWVQTEKQISSECNKTGKDDVFILKYIQSKAANKHYFDNGFIC